MYNDVGFNGVICRNDEHPRIHIGKIGQNKIKKIEISTRETNSFFFLYENNVKVFCIFFYFYF